MGFSSTATQQRDRQASVSKSPLAWGIASSLAFHMGILPAVLLFAWKDAPPEPAQIEIVVTEPIEDVRDLELETAVLDEETVDEIPVDSPATPDPVPPVPESFEEDPEPAESAEVVDPETAVNSAEPQPNQQLDNLLAEIRQRRQSRSTTQSNRPLSRASTGSGEVPNSGEPDRVAARSGPPQSSSPGRSRTVACRSCPKPTYPRSALDAGAEGTVNIMVDISPNGGVISASLVGSSGHSALDQAALSTVRNRWRFQPIQGGANGVVVSVVMTIQGSELNRRAQEQGDRQSVDIPPDEAETQAADSEGSSDTAASAASDDEQRPSESSEATFTPTESTPTETPAEPAPPEQSAPPESTPSTPAPVEPEPIPAPPSEPPSEAEAE